MSVLEIDPVISIATPTAEPLNSHLTTESRTQDSIIQAINLRYVYNIIPLLKGLLASSA